MIIRLVQSTRCDYQSAMNAVAVGGVTYPSEFMLAPAKNVFPSQTFEVTDLARSESFLEQQISWPGSWFD
jgi:hypothetical protein